MTMDPAVKVAMALCVLVGGFCAAVQFRRTPPHPPTDASAEQLRIGARRATAAQAVASDSDRRTSPTDRGATSSVGRSVTVVRPAGGRASPVPLISKSQDDAPTSSPWQPPKEIMLPLRQTARTHRIVDGDTLEGLAGHYLGSVDHAAELFDANRDVLANPKILPIGVELKIPVIRVRQSPR